MQTNYIGKVQLYVKYTRMWLWKEYCHWSSKLGSRTKFSSWSGELLETPLVPTAENMSCVRWIYKAWAFYDALGTKKDYVSSGVMVKKCEYRLCDGWFVSTWWIWGAQILSQTLFWVFLWGHFWMSLGLKLVHWVRQIAPHNVGSRPCPISWKPV